jgi:hypothetical protein
MNIHALGGGYCFVPRAVMRRSRSPGLSLVLAALVATAFSHQAAAASLPGSFRGDAYGTNSTITVGPIAASLGKTALLPCPCQGTNGATQQNNITSLSVGPGGVILKAGAVTSTVYARKTTTNTAQVSNTSTITGLNLFGGLVTATAVKAVASVNATASQLNGNSTGSVFTNLVIDGNPISVNPAPGTTITLPGIATIKLNNVVVTGNHTKQRNVTVEMLRIELLPGNSFGLPAGAKIVVAHAVAGYVRNQLPNLVGGQAYAATANATIGSVLQNKIGKAALVSIGCDGTNGKTVTNEIANLDVGNVLNIGTGKTTAFGGIDGSSTVARTTAKIENASLLKVPPLNLPLIGFTAITAAVEDKFNGSIHTRSVAGTQFAGLKVAGLNIPVNVAPNTRIDLLGFGYVILNEQVVPTATKKGIMKVNGLRLVITNTNVLGLKVGSEIIVAHAEATAQR